MLYAIAQVSSTVHKHNHKSAKPHVRTAVPYCLPKLSPSTEPSLRSAPRPGEPQCGYNVGQSHEVSTRLNRVSIVRFKM